MSEFNSKIVAQKCQKLADEISAIVKFDRDLYNAFASIDREVFVPKSFKHQAYKLDPLPISQNQWISSPLTVAKMTLALEISKDVDSVLEIGCGSGYQAAILSKLIRRVFTVERIEPLLLEAKKCFKMLGISNIHARFDDGQKGWRDYAPYDRILLSASVKKIPETLLEQLAENGVLAAPIETGSKQVITQFIKTKSGIRVRNLEECLFVPILNGISR
ncbi:MAG: protein-L-isoaspartate(D-aspartate) O-methyltransferase [Campylobacteraceae bacterium]|jgi:protein-L-isoaspartate(D-aspartate) O-methyltransferase|nr:protein-L-isoaspartate(D-aspartate) O-methyltransferase [Campylobacteraceae bacterium]